MADTITEFLIGFGYDFDNDSAREVESSLDLIKTKALQLGAVVAGAFGFKSLTADFAATNDMLGKFASTLDVDASRVAAFGRALEHEGGTLDSFLVQLENLERLRAGVRAGDVGFIGAAGRVGLDVSGFVQASNTLDAYLALADEFENLDSQQRLNAAQVLGLDMASIRLLRQGRGAIEGLVGREEAMRPITSEMTDEAARFNDEMQDLLTNIGGLADIVSMKLLPSISNMLEQINDYVDENRNTINDVAVMMTAPLAVSQEANDELWMASQRLVSRIFGIQPETQSETQSESNAGQIYTGLIQRGNPVYTETVQRLDAPVTTVAVGSNTPESGSTTIRVEMPVILDGSVIDKKVKDIDAGINRDTLESIKTGVDG